MAPADLPYDGFGGYLYNSPISLPNYANTTISTSYAIIDYFLFTGSGSATTIGVLFGACLMTLIHVLVFTTPDKRGRIIFNCIVAGLVLEVIRNFTGIWSVTRSGTNSSYFLLTLPTNAVNETDAENLDAANKYTNFSLGTNVNDTINEIASLLAFVAVQVCFYVLVHTMMSAMRRKTVRLVTILLAGLGCHAVIWRLVQVVWNTINVFHQTAAFAPPGAVQFGTTIAYTVSVCAWCLVYGYLIIHSALTRIRMGLEFKRGEARHMMFMTALESMIIPRRFDVRRVAQVKGILTKHCSNVYGPTMDFPLLVSRVRILRRPINPHPAPLRYTVGKHVRP